MAAITSAASGNWSVGATWVGGVAPVGGASGDDVTIAKNHVITLDNTSCVAKSLKLAIGTTGADVGGKLVASTTANSKLQVHQGILGLGSTGGTAGSYSSTIELDMSAASAYTCTIAFNDAQATTSSSTDPTASGTMYVVGKATFKGAARTRWTFTQAALVANTTKSVVVDDATGWKVGDILVFATTQAYNATPRVDKVTIDTITPGSGTTAAVTWADGTGTGGAVLYGHDTSCLVGNFTSNLRFVPTVAQKPHTIALASAHAANNVVCDNVEFYRCHCSSAFGAAGVYNPSSTTTTPHSLSNCAFYDPSYSAVMLYAGGRLERSNNVYYAPTSMSAPLINIQSPVGTIGDDTDSCVFMHVIGGSTNSTMSMGGIGMKITRPKISGVTGQAVFGTSGSYGDAQVLQGGVWSSFAVDKRPNVQNGFISIEETYIGKGIAGHVYANANNAYVSQLAGSGSVDYVSCLENLTGGARADAIGATFGASETRFYNKNGDAAVQEIYATAVGHTAPVYTRATDVTKNANASLKIATLAASTFKRTFSVLVKGGAAATILLYVRKNADYNNGTFTLPSATLSGLGITPITASGTNVDDTWELLDLSYASGAAPSSDGLLTLTLSAMSATATGVVYFSGIPLAPFVTRCRHYGYVFDETSPTRTVDLVKSADFATADAYTGMSITWGGASSSVALTGNTTFQKLYDYHQAKATQNVGSALALTGAGVAGSPTLFAAGNVTTTGFTLNGAGSLAMGANTLTATGYTYTGGTFSQVSTVPGFAGGVLSLPTAGSYAYGFTGGEIKFGAASTAWNLSDSTFNGSVHFSTSTGSLAVTVAVPAGLSYTKEGANITVTEPVQSAPITWAGALDATTVLLYNDSNAGAIIDTQVVSGVGGYVWNITLPHADVAVGDTLRLRFGNKAYYADELQGTMTATGIAFVGAMTLHPVYAAWGLNGATYDQANGGPYTMDGPNLQIDISTAGTTTGLKTHLGAWTQYLMTRPAGLDAFYGGWDLLAVNQIRQNVGTVDVLIDVVTAGALFTFTDHDVNYYRSDFSFPGLVQAGHGLPAMTYNASIFVPPPTIISGESVVTGTPETVADAVRTELAAELADITKARKVAQNKQVLDPASGLRVVYDDDGTTVLGQGSAYMDVAGTQPYNGTGPVHRTERLA